MTNLIIRVHHSLRTSFRKLVGIRIADRISQSERDTCDRYGEQVIGTMLAGGFTPSTSDLRTLYQTEETREHARDWLTERADIQEWRDRWVSGRDLLLEIVVIALIGWEIHMGYQQEKHQAESFQQEYEVMKNLQQSSAATAETLIALRDTSVQMNQAVQTELALSYEVSVKVDFEILESNLRLANMGRSSVALWGTKFGDLPAIFEKEPKILAPGVPNTISARSVYKRLMKSAAMGQEEGPSVPLALYVNNERGEKFVARYQLLASSSNGPIQVHVSMISVSPNNWSKKAK